MLNDAAGPHASRLADILGRAITEWAILGNPDELDFTDARVLYTAAYALIRVGNAVAEHSRQLELVYPAYPWVFWVDLRNELANETEINAGNIARTVTRGLPDLIYAITGQSLP